MSERKRDQADRLFQQALELEQTGAPLDAIEMYRSVLEIDPGFAGALVNLGTMFFTARDLEKAQQYYTEALAADPSYALAHFNLGNLHDEQGNRPAALAEYHSAIRLQPTYADAHYNIALLYQAMGQVMRAVRHWKTYLKLDPMSPWATIARRELKRLYRETVVDTSKGVT
ncbi:MAG: tetratricopeptide repeat protein [bacterium]|nr:tetratricopeptide repeat protein [bacterium]